MPRERVLITVKTYPTLSRTYGETVCTAGIKEDGSWVRIYPVPFRRLGQEERYRKYDWIECDLVRNLSDPRPETHRPIDFESLRVVGHVGTDDSWAARRRLLFSKCRVYANLAELIEDGKANIVSLAIFKPTKLTDFVIEETSAEWDPKRLEQMRSLADQLTLFDEEAWRRTFQVIPKLPYKFSYRFEDDSGRRSELQILDWEIGQLYWNCLRQVGGNVARAHEQVREKYFIKFSRTDLHFYLGTLQQFHFVAPNPWAIVGVLPIPHENQLDLLDTDHEATEG